MATSLPAATTVWDFNPPSYLSASSGHAVMDYRGTTTESNTYFSYADDFNVPYIEGQGVSYMSFPQSDRSGGFSVSRAYNGPTLDSYTLLWDILVPGNSFGTYSYMGLFNTDPVGNNDSELFIDLRSATAGQLFVDRDRDNGKVYSTSTGIIQPDTWHRVVFAYDENDPTEDVRVFVDGTKVAASDSTYGEIGLRLPGTFPMFQDGGQDPDHAPGCVASTALVERAMTDAEIAALGGPKANGFAAIYDPGDPPVAPPAGTNAYATALGAINPLVYFRLNEAAGKVVPDSVQNDGSLTTLAATWGTTGYTNTAPESGAEGPNPSWTAAGEPLVGFETGNLAAKFRGRFPDNANSDMLDLGANPTELDLETVTWSFWMNSGNTCSASGESNKFLISTPRDAAFVNKLVVVLTASSEIKILTDETAAETPNEAITTGLQIADSQWHHIVVVRNGANAANCVLYVDGVAVGLTTMAETLAEAYSYRIGTSGSNSSSYTGWLDEIACWNRELSSTEVSNLFYAAIGGEPIYAPGDATKNGIVDAADARILATNWGQTGCTWGQGDFNKDGVVNALDASILAANWGFGQASENATAVPEPTVLVMLFALPLMLLRRQRR
ncbi:MAG: hypothetical protein GX621_17935 [Pirellulaceae bacterium]|nr:hypothetical protein [Pirellulaceae bacterium]